MNKITIYGGRSMEIEVKYFGEIYPRDSKSLIVPYSHQQQAMKALDIMNQRNNYSTLIVLPTGGGKTSTASLWLLKNAIDKKKKVFWIAHRTMLLEQAALSFQQNADIGTISHISSFKYRIVSGRHDRSVNIEPTDNLLIASKDSINKNLVALDKWLVSENEIFLVIDEAHHAVAKTYQNIIAYVKSKVSNLKIIGLTATPFRTADNEKGLLSKLFLDGLNENGAFDDSGIAYKVDLKELINKQILSRPHIEECDTQITYGEFLGKNDQDIIEHFDKLPDKIAEDMAMNNKRNKFIVNHYIENRDKYEQTIVFVYNIVHAIQLRKQFEIAGIAAAYVVSNIKDATLGVTISPEENERNIQAFRDKKIKVLINVNILTEGVDLPQTKSVFLVRPTVSMTLMTQMVGRALRGVRAKGTKDAYIVSFIDDWRTKFSWVSPSELFKDEGYIRPSGGDKNSIRWIAISKIEEFAKLLDNSIDDETLDKIRQLPFEKRIPIGMYAFRYQEQSNEEQEGADISHQIMIYDSTKLAYEHLMEYLPTLFKSHNCVAEYLAKDILDEMENECCTKFFGNEMIPPYDRKDIVAALKYYAQKGITPQFYPFDDIDREDLNIEYIAQYIVDEDFGSKRKAAYLEEVWNEFELLRIFFSRFSYFISNIENEIWKIVNADREVSPIIDWGKRPIEDFPLIIIRKYNPILEKQLRDGAFDKGTDSNGNYRCPLCGKTSKHKWQFEVDHILPMSNGGKSVPENLRILCRSCNRKR